jgi:radical SAM protein with 4Fe4S-binding SPASM domain
MEMVTIDSPIFVDWAITTNCTLSCRHCRYLVGGKKKKFKELSSDALQDLVQELLDLSPHWFLIEGGEPFLREDLFDILQVIRERNKRIPIYLISSGNGFRAEYGPILATLSIKVMISVDSVEPDTYKEIRPGADFVEMINALFIAQENKILDSINFTLQDLNASKEEIQKIGRFASLMGVSQINILGIKPSSKVFKKKPWIRDLPQLFSEIINIQEKYNLKINVDEPFFGVWCQKNNIQLSTTKSGPIVVDDRKGCIFGEYLFVEPDGSKKPCSFSPLTIQALSPQKIKEISNKKNRKGKCGKCDYQAICGGCRVRTYILTGDWFESDPYCPL